MSLTNITITQRYLAPSPTDGSPQGTVTVQLQESLTDTATGTVVAPVTTRTPVVDGVMVPVTMPASNDPTTAPVGILYHFTEEISGAPTREFDAVLPYNALGGTTTLSALYAAP